MNRSQLERPAGMQWAAYREFPDMKAANAVLGFLPAFMDTHTHETHLSINDDGSLALIHLLDGLPDHWVLERDEYGRITALKDGIVAGFMRQGHFYTRSQLAQLRWDA
ncbi:MULTISPECIES: hypothetical protein [unclassified Ectothiorhodospira]|uniref:hypothetical protein n=1 Tax=unclassified Ectothiorhodospira TaxID=2684909 RepID=UPI001EE98794|nr:MULTISPECIES: hypothetical protein [unclassified Ectothiorhodospira]MCG5515891.1 hypothetical protein [Ectothiorhodospira sp. 9100]MCG5518769.1 hypothetical protein [Ectothiorhodospira sp. 9905]